MMITSIKQGRSFDNTCVLDNGDHPFINHPSYILYRTAETVREPHIKKMIGKKYYIPREDFEEATFSKIALGIFNSDETRGTMLRYATEVGLGSI